MCLLEAAYPIFKAKGLRELRRYASFLRRLPLARGVQAVESVYEDLMRALELAAEHPEVFLDEEGNLCLFDALIASAWLRTGLPLATSDRRLLSLVSAVPGLRGIELEKRWPQRQRPSPASR